MQDGVFCKIAEGTVPANKVYEDEDFLAFLDIRPLNPGHSLVIPKKHYQWVFDVEDFGKYFEVVKKVSLATKKVLNAESVSLVVFGHDVPHAHVWVVPRFENDGHGYSGRGFLNFMNVKQISAEEMKRIAEKIRAAI